MAPQQICSMKPIIHKVALCRCFDSVDEVFGLRGYGILRKVARRGPGVMGYNHWESGMW